MVAVQRQTQDDHMWHLCKALGNPVRIEILRYIQRHPGCIGNQIMLQLPMSCARAQSTLSQHLKVLRDAQLLEAENDGPATTYTVNEDRLRWLRERLGELVE